MIPVATVEEIKALDEKARAGDLDKGFSFMQKASRIVFDLVISEILQLQKVEVESTVLILCGKGNNGGDGLLTASYLIEQGYPVKCFLFADPSELEGEAKMAFDYLIKVKTNACTLIKEEKDLFLLKDFMNNLTGSNYHCFVLDAIYGIGFKIGKINKIFQQVTEIINQSPKEKTVIAIDGPSGIDNNNGLMNYNPIKAKYTLAMGFPKLGNFFFPARAFIGMMLVGDLKYELQDVQESLSSKLYFIDNVKHFFPGRALNGSKYDHGYVVNVAGSKSMTGAAIFSSKAALKAGAGMVSLYSEAQEYLHGICPELLLEKINSESLGNILSNEKIDVISMGPGLGRNHDNFIHEIVAKSTKPLILDADAINAFSGDYKLLKNHKSELLITPHLGEYRRLFPDELNLDLSPTSIIDSLKRKSSELGITILLKGSPTLISDSSGEIFIIPYGNSGLATAGSGDVLTGLITGFMAQSYKRQNKFLANSKLITQNAILGAYLHAKTAEIIAPEITEYSMMASDILNNLHRGIKSALN
jgi:ADP-dependent NAD(P)H-hydrate dehydratase / NAD(P)H-hydrate epimerase